MVGNDWVNSYLEAILAAEPGIGNPKSSLLLREHGHFSPTRYFVEEVITGFDETDLHRSWVQAAAIRSPQVRNTRLENLCWRIWNLARQKKQVEVKNAKRVAKRHLEREKARKEVTADMSEDFSEGEKADFPGEIPSHSDHSTKGRMSLISSIDVFENWFAQHKEKKLYIVLISLHGLIRGENMELGRDSDTGGQLCLDASEIIITSTMQEIEEQWCLYDGFDPVLERKLRARMKRGVRSQNKGSIFKPSVHRTIWSYSNRGAHGLPTVATINGGPVDIHWVLDNGLLLPSFRFGSF